MGIFHVDIDVVASGSGDAERHLVLVDTGASYLSLPGSVLRRLGYRPLDRQRVIFATGQVAVRPVTEVKVRLLDRERTVIAFFAEETAPKLVGARATTVPRPGTYVSAMRSPITADAARPLARRGESR